MTNGEETQRRSQLIERLRLAVDGLEHSVGGFGTAILALALLVWLVIVAAACLIGIGLLLVPSALQAVRALANRERARLSRWGTVMIDPGEVPRGIRAALQDQTVRKDLGWVVLHVLSGISTGILSLSLPLYAVQDATFPLWWRLLPPGSEGPSIAYWPVNNWADALAIGLMGAGWLALSVVLLPGLARLQAWPGRQLLPLADDADLSLRIAHLTATRAAALDAHATELRRIERSLHDGTQNRLVAVTVLLGAARRAVTRNPDTAAEVLERAQDAAEQALAELRTVVRSIHPPVLADRGLEGALTGLARDCAVPCQVDIDLPGRCAASVEATAYFVVAEALTNVARHSGARNATVTVRRNGDRLLLRVTDDGKGGADEERGSGLTGIRRRVAAFDGRLTLTSPQGGPTTMEVELPCGL
ncbi:sensor histidine kinase [Symbioplanes lichenis]|uniref:sensor histidine kinase n=1 Tax=Symbioplanes lichenis TaxID=1629072 RepID=UPI002739D484|nr:sensor histidine kinase [Actinoplanes lichenis]